MEHPEIYQELEELYEKEKYYIMYEKQIQLENEWRQWEEEQEKVLVGGPGQKQELAEVGKITRTQKLVQNL